MAEVCGQLSEMVELVDDFFKFLGPELKAVTGGHSLPAQYNYRALALAEGAVTATTTTTTSVTHLCAR